MTTHEIRSSLDNNILAPFTRIDSKNMTIATILKSSKLGLLNVMLKVNGGKHTKLKKFKARSATEAVIEPSSEACYVIDGELYANDLAHVKVLPGFLNLMGSTLPMEKKHIDFKDNL